MNIQAHIRETEINITHINNEPSINSATLTDERRISGVFCSKTAFNISHKILTKTKTKVLEKRLDFAPVQRTFNVPELRKDFEEFQPKF